MIDQGLCILGKGILSKHLDETLFGKLLCRKVTYCLLQLVILLILQEIEELERFCGCNLLGGCDYYF